MLEFTEHEQEAQTIAIHYARKLGNEYIAKVLTQSAEISSKEDAEVFTRFYWAMVDQAVEDQEGDVEVEGAVDLQFWMEKLLSIFMGYLKSIGMYDVWDSVSDEINGR